MDIFSKSVGSLRMLFIIDREAGEIIRLVASVCLCVCGCVYWRGAGDNRNSALPSSA